MDGAQPSAATPGDWQLNVLKLEIEPEFFFFPCQCESCTPGWTTFMPWSLIALCYHISAFNWIPMCLREPLISLPMPPFAGIYRDQSSPPQLAFGPGPYREYVEFSRRPAQLLRQLCHSPWGSTIPCPHLRIQSLPCLLRSPHTLLR
jgi:hypothetical protein